MPDLNLMLVGDFIFHCDLKKVNLCWGLLTPWGPGAHTWQALGSCADGPG